MPANNNQPTYENLREAFCASRRCQPERFPRKVFWRTLSRVALLPALLGGGSRAPGYQKDIEAIQAVGDARSADEFERALEEFFTLNLLERDFWRGRLGLRVSGVRLSRLFRPLVAKLRPEAPELPVSPPTSAGAAIRAHPASASDTPAAARQQSAESELAILRKLRRVHELVVGGTQLHVALGETGIEGSRIGPLMEEFAVGRPDLAWLQGYLTEQRELDSLRHDNARLTRLVADLTMQLNHQPALHHVA